MLSQKATLKCPNDSLLKTYKMFPRLHEFSYMRDKYFIYVYLNPFKEYRTSLKFKVQGIQFCSAFEPIYVGKGTNGNGYRHNQHISAFLNNKENNRIKVKIFKEIENEMKKAKELKLVNKPWDWQEYQKGWVFVVRSLNSQEELKRFEMQMINTIGTRWDATGPLVNKIKN